MIKFDKNGNYTPSGCNYCTHFNGRATCEAFKDGIPIDIINGDIEHFKPIRGQKNKITFERIKG